VNENVDLGFDDVVLGLDTVEGMPDLLALAGYLGPAHGEGAESRVRLFSEAALQRWIEIDRSVIRRRERLTPPKGVLGPLTVIWVDSAWLRAEEFPDAPDLVEMSFLNDRADLYFEPPKTMLEAVEYLKLQAYHYNWGVTKKSRKPTWHC
jgi:hypothetical protein